MIGVVVHSTSSGVCFRWTWGSRTRYPCKSNWKHEAVAILNRVRRSIPSKITKSQEVYTGCHFSSTDTPKKSGDNGTRSPQACINLKSGVESSR